ncbi:hypothetical protein DH2020_012144 [Rehmannia glutinosa]|uniref:Uncharacterized protein n=1 Tax=Rehmannia glutinosa TaxID=99300 RepID=A0ABR0XFH0_REHGL
MRDLNEDSSSSSWPLYYGDNAMTNGQYYNGFTPRTIIDGYPGYGKDALKQKMLEHEAVFKNQVFELHRLYRIQRDMMEEVKRKELNRLRVSMEPSSSSSRRESQVPTEDGRKWHMAADEYLDTEEGEKLPECKASDVSSPIGNPKTGRESTNLSLGDRAGVNSASASCLRKSVNIRLADLNEPIEIEEAMAPSTVDFLDRNGERKGENQPAKSNAGYLRVSEESIHVRDGSSIKSAVESKVNERGWLSHLYEAGSGKSNLSSVTHRLHKEKMPIPSYPLPGTLNPLEHPPVNVIYPFGHSWAHPVPSWSKPTTSFTQKLTTMEPLDSPAVSNRSLQTSAPNVEPFRGKWQVNVNSKLNANLGGELTTTNGIFHGSASRSGETKVHLQSAGFDNNFNCSRADNVVSDRSTNHVFGYFPNGSCLGNSRPMIDINLNEAEDGKSEPEDHLSALPWLKRKPAHANETVADLNQPLDSSDCEIVRTAETQNVKKILGFPIFETGALENVTSEKNIGKERKNRIIDINLECEPDEEIAAEEPNFEKEKNETKGVSIRDYIDLNSCVSDCEDASVPSYESKAASVKIAFEIDLEAPVENEEAEENTVGEASLQLLQNKNETLQDEILRNAAETIFAISSSCPNIHSDNILHPSDASLAESLIWFADVVSSELESTSTVRDGSPRDLLDDFEAMTLQLQETKEEDYMPTPFVPGSKSRRNGTQYFNNTVSKGTVEERKTTEGLSTGHPPGTDNVVKTRSVRGSSDVWWADESHRPSLGFRVHEKEQWWSG